MKERTLGFEVFGRRPDDDTDQDPIVRAWATENRKRIAQYYHEPSHETELRIELQLGSYVPVFHLAAPAPVLIPVAGPSELWRRSGGCWPVSLPLGGDAFASADSTHRSILAAPGPIEQPGFAVRGAESD